ncbi:hypothetical protein K525DRAFT_196652 [Schizophyllum commune Loenen D]|nr:hypothetical protein K525DRAFT_196652 [Schizophyllum commune Loenen D]
MFFYVTLLRPPPASCSLPSTSAGPSTSNERAQHKAKASDKVSKSKNADKAGKSKGAGKTGSTPGIVNICPEISNDLRYENLDEPAGRDIYYSWIKCGRSGNPLAQPTTWPAKLTTYRADTSSRYKELPVAVPREAKHGDRWRLALWCEPAGQPKARPPSAPKVVIELCSPSLGAWPLPVMSEPVVFDGVPTEKQVLVSRVYSLRRVDGREAEDVLLTITERTRYNLATKVWDSGIGLSSWICGLAESHPDSELEAQMLHVLLSPGKRRIVELGAGTGILSFTLAALRQAFRRKRLQETLAAEGSEGVDTTERKEDDDEIFVTDLESALDLLDHNLRQNIHLYEARPTIPIESEATPEGEQPRSPPAGLQALELNWDKPDLPEAIARGGALDLVMMADVTYNTDSFPELVSTMKSLIALSPAPTPPPMFLLGYKQRHPDERVLWDMAEKQAGVHFVKVAERRGYARPAEDVTGRGEGPVEIWIGTVQR